MTDRPPQGDPAPQHRAGGGHPPAAPAGEPAFQVVAGHPTADELAAVMAALSIKLAARQGQAAAGRTRPGAWASRASLLRTPPIPGPDAWRRSARPC